MISGISQGLLAVGFPRPIGDPLLEGVFAVVVSPLGLVLFLHGRQLRKRSTDLGGRLEAP